MITLELPDTPSYRFALQESSRVVRSSRRKIETTLAAGTREPPTGNWVELNEVTSTTLTEDKVAGDPELPLFIGKQKGTFNFYYVRFGCTFFQEKDEPFEQAWLTVKLQKADGQPNGAPLVWSIQPEAEYDVTRISNKASIGAELKFVSSEFGSERQTEKKDYFLRGYREGRGAPFWEFTRTKQTPLKGSYALHMIVRSNKHEVIHGDVGLSATIGRKKYYLIPSVEEFPEKPVRNFTLSFN